MLHFKNCGNEVEQEIENLRREKEILVKEHTHLNNQLKGVSEMLKKLDEIMKRLGKLAIYLCAQISKKRAVKINEIS